jgi:hypothetical protein
MMRRVVTDDSVDAVIEHVDPGPPVADILAHVATVVYSLVVSLIGLDTLLTALGARQSNGFVSFIDRLSDPLLAPFSGMFHDQSYWATALVAAVVYTLVYLLVMTALRRDRVVRA